MTASTNQGNPLRKLSTSGSLANKFKEWCPEASLEGRLQHAQATHEPGWARADGVCGPPQPGAIQNKISL
jgi:hypothetical protein